MPVISVFFGIVIRMFFDNHPPPHFHAEYQGFRALVRISDGVIINGRLPGKAARIVRQWALDHQGELMANWQRGIDLLLLEIEIAGPQTVRLHFSDGTCGEWNLADIIARDTVMTRPLQDPTFFSRAFVDGGALAWPNGLEFSAGSLHHKLADQGLLARRAA